MIISIGNDHAGPNYKSAIVDYLQSKGHEIINHGTDTFDSVDYPDFGHPVAYDVESKKAHLELLFAVQEMELL
jgi:ribose 5-phosphate isomerase B